MSSATNRLKTQPAEPPEAEESPISDVEAAAIRAEKLAAIKKAVDAGEYDSDDLLEKAMQRMLDAVEKQADEQ